MTMDKDKGLKQALLQEQPMRLSSNFYYRVMQEVEKASVIHERKAKRRMLFLLICVSLALVAGGIAVLLHYCPGAFVGGVEYAVENSGNVSFMPLLALALLVLLLLFLDYWMRVLYSKRYADKR